ncbi:UHRF1BP1L [Branchiostoma lanceolatum]|uniref:UHRF1BP1L protein n=1 Tax=Branchiostoma lanceolatum TaxID=7740 RepID=A0A8K0EP59_BRALA|nr:UHRF1BP1L [Branchiostoma lanceolatum]
MESYIKKKILKHLSKFSKGLSVDKISLSTLKGEGELANLELDEIVLQDVLDLPTWVTIKKATCNKVAIKDRVLSAMTCCPDLEVNGSNPACVPVCAQGSVKYMMSVLRHVAGNACQTHNTDKSLTVLFLGHAPSHDVLQLCSPRPHIQWTKLKTHPICLYMDQIDIEMETCDEPRAPNNPSPFMSQGGDTKYGFAEKVVDGMSLTINSVTIRFISHAFTASFQVRFPPSFPTIRFISHAFTASFQVRFPHHPLHPSRLHSILPGFPTIRFISHAFTASFQVRFPRHPLHLSRLHSILPGKVSPPSVFISHAFTASFQVRFPHHPLHPSRLHSILPGFPTIRFISHAFTASFQVRFPRHPLHLSRLHSILPGFPTIRFISHAFTASFQLSRIRARSTTPQWQVADLRMTRIKDTERGMVLTFKEIDWQTLRIEADAVKTEKTNYVSTPVRLITNQSRIRIVIKKQLHDCSVVSSKLHLILDDLLWVLTDSQLKAMASYMQSLSKLIRKSTEQNKRDASSQPSPPSPQHHASQRSHAAAAGTAPRNPQLEAVSKFFSKYDMVETSYHIFTRRLDLHLCDDTNPMEQGKRDVLHWWQVCCPSEQEKFNRRTDGGAMQITFHRLMLDYYPYHFVGMNKKHWFRHSECMDARDQWAELLLAEFKHQLKEWKKATADAAEGQESKDGSQEEVRGQQPGARGHKPRPKLMSSGIVFRLEDFELYQVSTSDTRHSTPKKFFSSDKKALYLPQEMSAVHLEYTEYYFPEGVDHPVPSPNIYGQINAVQLTLDYMTVLWANQFLLNVAQSMAAAPMDRQESVEEPASASLHVDIRLEILMPKVGGTWTVLMSSSTCGHQTGDSHAQEKPIPDQPDRPQMLVTQSSRTISLPAEKPVPDQPDRPQMLVAQSSRTVLTNSRISLPAEKPVPDQPDRPQMLVAQSSRTISLPAEKPVADQPDRPQMLVAQSSRTVLTNSRVGTNCTREDLKAVLDNFSASVLFRDEERFPNKDGDFQQVCNEFWDEAMHDGISFDTSAARPPPIGSTNTHANVLRGERSKDVWLMYFEQFWVDFGEVATAKGRPLPFIDAVPLHLWVCKPLQGHDDPSQIEDHVETGGHVSSGPSQVRGHKTPQSQRRRHQSGEATGKSQHRRHLHGEADQSQHRRHLQGEADQSQHRRHLHGEANQSQHRQHPHGEADQSQHRRHRSEQRPSSGSQSGMKSYQNDQPVKRPHHSDQSASTKAYHRTQSEPRGHSLRQEDRSVHRGAQKGGSHSSDHHKDRHKREAAHKQEQGSEKHVVQHHKHEKQQEEGARDEKRKRLMEYYRGSKNDARKEKKSPGSEEDELVREMFSNQPPAKRLSSTFKTKSLSDSDSSPDQENVFMNGPVAQQKGGADAVAGATTQQAAFSVAEIPAFRENKDRPLERPPVSQRVIPEERPFQPEWETARQSRPVLSRDRSLSSPELDKASAFERMLRGRSISVDEVLSSDDPTEFDGGREFGRTEADSHMLLHTPSKVCGVVTHDQYLFLLRLQESIAQLQDCMEEDGIAIRGRPSNVSSSCIAGCCRQVELSLILPSPPEGTRAANSAAGSTLDVAASSERRRSSLQTDTLMVPGSTTPRTTSPSPVDSGIAESTAGNHVAKSQSDTALMSLSSDEENNGGDSRKRRNLSSGERPKSFTGDDVTTLRKSPSRDGPDSGRGSGNVADSAPNERQENARTDPQDRASAGAMPTKQVPKLTVSDGTKEVAKDSPYFEKKFGKFSDFSAANIAAQLRIGLLSQSQLSLDEMSLDNFSLDNMSLDSTDSGDPYLLAGNEMSTLSVDTLSISSQVGRCVCMWVGWLARGCLCVDAPTAGTRTSWRGRRCPHCQSTPSPSPLRWVGVCVCGLVGTWVLVCGCTDSGDPYLLAGNEMSTLSVDTLSISSQGSRSAPVSHQSSFERGGDAEPTRQTSLEDGRDGRPTALSGEGEGSTRPKKVTLEYCDSESSTEEVSQSVGSSATLEEAKKRKTATVLVLHLSDVGLELSNHERDNFTKLQGQEVTFEERREVDVQDFLAKISQTKKDVPIPASTDVPPNVSARLESGPHAARYSPNAPKLGHLELQLQGAAGVVTMSTLTGVASLIEDEILATPMPMRVDFIDSQLSLVDDGPPLNPGSPGSIPLDIHVDRATVVRMEDGIFHLTCLAPSPRPDIGLAARPADYSQPGAARPGLQAGGHTGAAQLSTLKDENDHLQREVARLREQQKGGVTSQLLSENLCLQGEKQRLREELLDTQHALQEVEQERTSLLRTLEHVQREMLEADREKSFLRDQLERRSPRK